MNKKQYMDALEKALRQNNVADVEDVLADYQAHFTRKALDGYTEEDIAHRLGNPEEIAADFLPGRRCTVQGGRGEGTGADPRCALLCRPVRSAVFPGTVSMGGRHDRGLRRAAGVGWVYRAGA